MWNEVIDSAARQGVHIRPDTAQRIGGGSINEAWRVEGDTGPLFVKFNSAQRYEMFAAEAEGLQELSQAGAIRVPDVVCVGTGTDKSFLVLEYLDLQPADAVVAGKLGASLAQMHSHRGPAFGWHRDNTIGATPQINSASRDGVSFFRTSRLQYQLKLARKAGAGRLADAGYRLCENLPHFFDGICIEPVLLHGDLWGGNWGSCDNEPVVFDPAVYYGDAESDIAMTRSFGGFPDSFYQAYRERLPDQPGGHQRRELYRLYHVLNHYNLFGGGYAAQAERMIAALLAES